ncbi:MAG: GTPase [Candidatus Diapherotrites archaeon]
MNEIKRKTGKIPCIFVSAKERKGIRKIRELIGILSKGRNTKIGFIGYPNTGKSSVINALKGKKVAKTSIKAGLTRGEQFFRLSDKIKLIDSPGVIPMDEFDESKLILFSAKSPEQAKDPEYCGEYLIEYLKKNFPEKLRKMGIKDTEKEAEELLGEIAFIKKKLSKGGKPDVNAASKIILLQWQKGML